MHTTHVVNAVHPQPLSMFTNVAVDAHLFSMCVSMDSAGGAQVVPCAPHNFSTSGVPEQSTLFHSNATVWRGSEGEIIPK